MGTETESGEVQSGVIGTEEDREQNGYLGEGVCGKESDFCEEICCKEACEENCREDGGKGKIENHAEDEEQGRYEIRRQNRQEVITIWR